MAACAVASALLAAPGLVSGRSRALAPVAEPVTGAATASADPGRGDQPG